MQMYTPSFNVANAALSADEKSILIAYRDTDGIQLTTERPSSCFRSWLKEKGKLRINNQEFPEMTIWEYFFTSTPSTINQDVAAYMDSLMAAAHQERDLTSYSDEL